MSAPRFTETREELALRLEPLLDQGLAAEVLAYPPLTLRGASPVLSAEDAGFQGVMLEGDYREYDLGFNIVARVNREAHGAFQAAQMFDQIRARVLVLLTATDWTPVNFLAIQLLPGGAPAPTYLEIIDGVQHLVGEIPLLCLTVACDEDT